MGLSDLNFASGFQGGLNSGLNLINQLDARKRQATKDKRDEAEYQYKLNTLRPREEELAALKMRDLKGSIAHREQLRPMDIQGKQQGLVRGGQQIRHAESNQRYAENVLRPQQQQRHGLTMLQGEQGLRRGEQQIEHADSNQRHTESVLRPQQQQRHGLTMLQGEQGLRRGEQQMQIAQQAADWAKQDRPMEQAIQRFQFGKMKNGASRAQAQERRVQQAHNLKLAGQQYQSAMAAYESGNTQEALRLIIDADELSGGLFGNMAAGVNGQMASLSRDVAMGKRALDDPEFTQVAGRFVSPSMRTSGRDGYRFDGVQSLPNGQLGYRLKPEMGGEHMSAISEASQRFGVDPDLIAAVIGQESAGDVKAKSSKGAFGLMQLMPATGKEVAQRIGLKDFDPKNPQHNILVGTAYLKQQIDKYGNDPERVLAAYNAGPGAVDKHKGVPPFKETQNYIKKVMGNYKQLKQGVPATHGMSADDDDRIVAHTPEELTATVQHGAAMERQFLQNTAPELLQALNARLAGVGAGVTRSSAKPTKQWSKLDDSTLYNAYTGDTKQVGGAGQSDADALSNPKLYEADGTLKMQGVDAHISAALPHLSPMQRQRLRDQAMQAGPMSATDLHQQVLQPLVAEQSARVMSEQIKGGVDVAGLRSSGVDPALIQAHQALSERANKLMQLELLDDNALDEIVIDSLNAVGEGDQGVLLAHLNKRLDSIEQHAAAVKKHHADNPIDSNILGDYR